MPRVTERPCSDPSADTGRPVSERRALALNRAVVVAGGVAALVFAYVAQDLVFWLVLFAWGRLGAAFGPALICSLAWRGTTRAGVVASMLTGAAATVVWKQFFAAPTGLYEFIVAFPAATVVIVGVSLMGRARRARTARTAGTARAQRAN